MLTMTDNAVLVIRDLAAQQDVSDAGGLRIAADTAAGSLTVELVEQPAQGDQVVDTDGARIFLDSDAAELLTDTSVDASVDDEGVVQFGFTEKPAH
ncbi:HesB/IscA family protein [Micromonospora cathayae]|uniref:Iron-sulfur cluster biosynthesis family protein n=1 Tax=Micromonospora cathayae TaxID=3028804 RepID=A0ABY7ZYD5_9ACTN|nr:iron-sulfur cluster biosynthesis family protein [Micromonospora sp. HUAS 3]WDZ87102.1 iron-sulfur cluster biosynthesis family protein [Micromonospora sp. HUAS 3]